jgi:hypothetical protein
LQVAWRAQQPPAEHLEIAGLAIRRRLVWWRRFATFRAQVEQDAQDLGARQAVDGRVVDLRQ